VVSTGRRGQARRRRSAGHDRPPALNTDLGQAVETQAFFRRPPAPPPGRHGRRLSGMAETLAMTRGPDSAAGAGGGYWASWRRWRVY